MIGRTIWAWTVVICQDPGLDGIYACFEFREVAFRDDLRLYAVDEDGVEVSLSLNSEPYQGLNRAQLTRIALQEHAKKRKDRG